MEDMNEILRECEAIDKECYALANEQAAKIEKYLMEHDECCRMVIELGTEIFTLDITHTEILNCIYTMLENLKELGD